jgi:MFS family permease
MNQQNKVENNVQVAQKANEGETNQKIEDVKPKNQTTTEKIESSQKKEEEVKYNAQNDPKNEENEKMKAIELEQVKLEEKPVKDQIIDKQLTHDEADHHDVTAAVDKDIHANGHAIPTESKEIATEGTPIKEHVEGEEEEEEREFNVRWGNLYGLMFNISLGYFFFGYEVGVFNPLQNNIAHDLGWADADKKTYKAVISVMISCGGLIGAFSMGKVAAKIGRRKSYMIADAILIAGISITFIANTISMIIGRFICGLGVGGFVALTPLTMNEFVPDNMEGKGCALYGFMFNFGVLCSFALGCNTHPSDQFDLVWWRIMFFIPTIICLLNMFLWLFKFKYDTPKYLLLTNDRLGAILSFGEVYESKDDIIFVIEELESHLKKKTEHEQYTYAMLFSNRFNKQLFVGIFLHIALQATALSVFNYYSTSIFLRTLSMTDATLYSAMLGVAKVAGALVAFAYYGKIKKKTILLCGFSVLAACLFTISLLEYGKVIEPEKFVLIFFYFIFGCSIVTVFEVGPGILPDIGVGILSMCYWLFTIAVVVSLPYMLASPMEFGWTCMFYCILLVVSSVMVAIFYKEPEDGATLNEVEELYATWC